MGSEVIFRGHMKRVVLAMVLLSAVTLAAQGRGGRGGDGAGAPGQGIAPSLPPGQRWVRLAPVPEPNEERNGVDKSLKMVLRAWRDICIQTMRTTIVSQTSSYIAPVLPIVLCAPKFLDGTMTLGEVMQAASAFTIVQAAFNWLVDNYPRLADWTASARRVALLQMSLDELERAEIGRVGRINRCERKGASSRACGSRVQADSTRVSTDNTSRQPDAPVDRCGRLVRGPRPGPASPS